MKRFTPISYMLLVYIHYDIYRKKRDFLNMKHMGKQKINKIRKDIEYKDLH